jgi:hypothetical protein
LIGALGLKYKWLPDHSTYRRVLADDVEGDDLEGLMGEYLAQLPRHGQDTVVAIDGKTVRGTITAEDPYPHDRKIHGTSYGDYQQPGHQSHQSQGL